MKKDVTKTKLDPATTRVFVKGVEITELVDSCKVEMTTEFFEHSTFGKVDKKVPIDQKITMTVNITGSTNSRIVASEKNPNDIILYIDEHPTDEFLAEMVRLKLRREGILDEGG